MAIKFARDIVKQIRERGPIKVPDGCVTGEAFEKWLVESKAYIANQDTSRVEDGYVSSAAKNDELFYYYNDIVERCFNEHSYIKEYIGDYMESYLYNYIDNYLDNSEANSQYNYLDDYIESYTEDYENYMGNENYGEAA